MNVNNSEIKNDNKSYFYCKNELCMQCEKKFRHLSSLHRHNRLLHTDIRKHHIK